MNSSSERNIIPSRSKQQIARYSSENIKRGLDLAERITQSQPDKVKKIEQSEVEALPLETITGIFEHSLLEAIEGREDKKWNCIHTLNTSLEDICHIHFEKKLFAISPNNQLLAYIDKLQGLRVLNLITQELVQTINLDNLEKEDITKKYVIDARLPVLNFLSDNQTIVLIDTDAVHAWNVFSGSLKYNLSGSYKFALDDSIIAVEILGFIKVFDLNTGDLTADFNTHLEHIEHILLDQKNKLLVISGFNYLIFEENESGSGEAYVKTEIIIQIWNFFQKELSYTFKVEEVENYKRFPPPIFLSPDGNILVSCSEYLDLSECVDFSDWIQTNHSSMKVWNLRSGKQLYSWPQYCDEWPISLDDFKINDNDQLVVQEKEMVKVYNLNSGEILFKIPIQKIQSAVKSPRLFKLKTLSNFNVDQNLVIANNKSLKIYSLVSGNILFDIPVQEVSFLGVSPDKKLLVGYCLESYILQVWSIETGKLLYTLPGHSKEINSIFWSEDSRLLVSTDISGIAKVWGVDCCCLK